MEFLLYLWDELDDWTAACRHVTSSAASELTGELVSLTTPFATAWTALLVLKILR